MSVWPTRKLGASPCACGRGVCALHPRARSQLPTYQRDGQEHIITLRNTFSTLGSLVIIRPPLTGV